jgi:hypothetical protein
MHRRLGRRFFVPTAGSTLDRQPGDRFTGHVTAGTHDTLVVDLVEQLVAYLTEHTPPDILHHGARGPLARE